MNATSKRPAIGSYDPDLQMFRESHDVDMNHLRFIRWLLIYGRLTFSRGDDEGAAPENPRAGRAYSEKSRSTA